MGAGGSNFFRTQKQFPSTKHVVNLLAKTLGGQKKVEGFSPWSPPIPTPLVFLIACLFVVVIVYLFRLMTVFGDLVQEHLKQVKEVHSTHYSTHPPETGYG